MRPPRRTPSLAGRAASAAAVTPFPHEVLVLGPEPINVPAFALAIEKERFETEVRILTSFSAARAALGRNAALALRAREFGPYQIVYRRQRLARQSVIYSVWLAFTTRDDADRFARAHGVGQ